MQGNRVGAFYSKDDRVDVVADHARILEGLRAGDAEQTESAMGRHLHNFLEFLREHHPAVLEHRLEPLMPATLEAEPIGAAEGG
jgi:DNA-binding GntR family transcriptional regulator